MSAHIDRDYVDNAITAAVVDGMTDSSAGVLTQLIEAASALVDSALKNAGFESPTGTVPDIVQLATLGALLPQLYGRKGLKVPEQFGLFGNTFEAIRSGDLEPIGLTPSTSGGVGGSDFTESDETIAGSKPKVMGGLRGIY